MTATLPVEDAHTLSARERRHLRRLLDWETKGDLLDPLRTKLPHRGSRAKQIPFRRADDRPTRCSAPRQVVDPGVAVLWEVAL